ncbi:MAG: hypothetical protein AABY18_04985 [Candidatus Thermoplasmatota archaeon]
MASHFVDLLGSDQATAGRRAVILLVVAALLAIPAYLIAPWQGAAVHVLAVVAGLVAGNLVSRRRARTYEASLRGTWKSWMRWSAACESVPEVHRRVLGKSGRNLPWLAAAGLTLLWAVEVGLLALAFANEGSLAFAIPVIALNGLVPAAIAAHFIHLKGWVRELSESLTDLVKAGEIGVWGVL